MCDYCTRREFLQTGVAAGLLLTTATWTHAWAAEARPVQPRGKSRICVIFTGPPGPADRGWNADAKQLEAMKARLGQGGT
jgi:hypothetical protein